MINRLEMILYKIMIWGVVPTILFLAGWWSSIGLADNEKIFSIALGGLGLGILIDALILKPKLKSIETLKFSTFMIIYVFYSIMVLGFFMGVPVFNMMLGILAGRFMVRVGLYKGYGLNQMKTLIRSTAVFVTVVMIGICLISAWIALVDPLDTAINLQGMLGLGFTVVPWMVFALVFVGGIGLILMQYYVTLFFAHYGLTHVYFDPKDPFYRLIS